MMRKAGLVCGLILLVVASSLGMGGSVARANWTSYILMYVDGTVLGAITSNGTAEFIVRFPQISDLSEAATMDWISRGEYVYRALQTQAEQSQQRATAYLDARGIRYQSFIASNVLYVFAGDLAAIQALSSLPEVYRISAPRTYPLDEMAQPLSGYDAHSLSSEVQGSSLQEMNWAVIDTQANEFWNAYGFAGEGILVATIDSGVQWDHPALFESYKCAMDPGDPACWYDPGGTCAIPCDSTGHGTATMGPLTGENEGSVPYQVGMAPEAQWISCKGCSDGGSCSDYDLLACADWILAPGGNPINRPNLVSNAWGSYGMPCDNWFDVVISNWLAAGTIATFRAGSGGPNCGTMASPGDHIMVFTSAAHDNSRMIASFSSRGPSDCPGGDLFVKPNVSAPGVTLMLPVQDGGWSSGYSGTSFSNAYGSGALVLLMSCAPELIGNAPALFDALQNSADTPPEGNCGAPPGGDGNFTYGHGYINMLTAGEYACDASGGLTGEVTDLATSNPLVGAVITATQMSDPFTWEATVTDGNGVYSMTLKVGQYDLMATYTDYAPAYATVEILTDTIAVQNFVLEGDTLWIITLPVVMKNP